MELKNRHNDSVELQLSREELLILNNALNEACNGLSLFDLETRMGATREEVQSVLKNIGEVLDCA